nr:immunoglobulin heavy chain junction region [Macaca mulatta]MOX93578.1 immunoglobulin heavy chain junction region [Macaca mulatta]MOX94533.1 immunoglobulin heavy chain junction region [Macaca mulatta]MOX96488.1 immunoglobulin heavy chain junction region [Macaca mulatta]
CTRGVVFFDNW